MYFNLINTIKLNVKQKNKFFKINVKKKELEILKIFIKLNIIKFIIKFNNMLIIKLNILKKNKIVFNIRNLYKPSNIKFINLKHLKKFYKSNIIIYMNSDIGIKNNFEILKNKKGGISVFALWN